MTDASLAQVREALAAAGTVPEEQQPAKFANHLLATMIVEPRLDEEQIATLPEEDVSSLGACAADLLGVGKEFHDTPGDLPACERLYRAHARYYDTLTKQLVSSFRPGLPESLRLLYGGGILGSVQDAMKLSGVADQLGKSLQLMSGINVKLMQPMLPPAFPGIGEQLKAYQDIASSVLQMTETPLKTLAENLVSIKLPEPFLSDALIRSGLNSPLIHTSTYDLPAIELGDTEEEVEQRAEEAQRRRILDAYDTLLALETSLREIVEAKLRDYRGESWWRQSVPHQVRTDCAQRKKDRERPEGLSHHPIAYTYIGDLKDTIVKGDNWGPVFEPVFGNKTTLEAMFIWVEPVRKDVAHSRPSSDEDYQYFTIAATWLQLAITRALKS